MHLSSHHGLPPINSADRVHHSNRWIFVALGLFFFTSLILFLSKKQEIKTEQLAVESEHTIPANEHEQIKMQLDSISNKYERMATQHREVAQMIQQETSVYSILKKRINFIINKTNTTTTEIDEAKILLHRMNNMLMEWETKNSENTIVSRDPDNSKNNESSKMLLEQQDQVPDFLIKNIQVIPVDLSSNAMVSNTKSSRKIDILRIYFDIVENRNLETYPQTFYIRIINPENKVLSDMNLGSGEFSIRDSKQTLIYTISTNLEIEPGTLWSQVNVDWEDAGNYLKGNYKIEIYHRGFLVGRTALILR